MDPATIAASVVAILAPYAKDAGKELVKTVGDVAVNKAKELLGWLKKRFEKDPVASSDLSRFEADPINFESGLKTTIQEQAEKDPAFASELKQRIDEIGPVIAVFQKIRSGKDITGAKVGSISSGKIGVTQEIEEGEKVTGFEAEKVGEDPPIV